MYSGGGVHSTEQYSCTVSARRAEGGGGSPGEGWVSGIPYLIPLTETPSPASSVTIGMMEIKMISRIVSGENKFQTTGDKTCKVLWESDKNAEQNCGIWIFRWQDMPYRTCENKTGICPDKTRISVLYLNYLTESNNDLTCSCKLYICINHKPKNMCSFSERLACVDWVTVSTVCRRAAFLCFVFSVL